ncbi:hypothetical protein GCM10009682_41000 [Luedemannella flava]|uniref:Uncharacterized protein n=1 Tax=Luedemannella flava TaxID=349316 RepID=A0ABP4YJA0_9ACTN
MCPKDHPSTAGLWRECAPMGPPGGTSRRTTRWLRLHPGGGYLVWKPAGGVSDAANFSNHLAG